MLFVLDEPERGEPPLKRRKVSQNSAMARRERDDVPEDRWDLDRRTTQRADEKSEGENNGQSEPCIRTSSREELIECIKRGQKPTWVPTPGFQALCDEEEALNAQRKLRQSRQTTVEEISHHLDEGDHVHFDRQPLSRPNETQKEPYERPRSALHRGDFSENDPGSPPAFWEDSNYQPGLAISTVDRASDPASHWYADGSRSTPFTTIANPRNLSQLNTCLPLPARRRAPSLGSSLSSSFIMRAPTSPLVHATSTSHLDDPSEAAVPEQPRNRPDSARRRTMPPNSFHSLNMSPIAVTPPNFSRPFAPALRREASMPSHVHRPQRSLSSFTYHPRSNPQTPTIRSRRPSMTSDTGSRRRTSMIGSFEESILRGRMSTPPSKPLDFVAQIGVMGKGDCQSSLKCPAHVSVPFPAVFYSYPASTGTRSVADDTPSPYVGTIDLEHNLKAVILAAKRSRKDLPPKRHNTESSEPLSKPNETGDTVDAKLHVGGAYRIPQQGQLQIVIKNPNKTAVKLFLVPYDLNGMEAGTKTFVRQRSYSTGSIIENALGGDKSVIQNFDPLQNKNILRYLVHLKFCCPAKNRFYLYDDIRVVFANRVPDGKEKLRNELQLPEPKFSPWKPLKPEADAKASKSAPSTPLVQTFAFGSPQFFGEMDGFRQAESPVSPTPSERVEKSASTFTFPKVYSRPNSPVWKMKTPSPDNETVPFEFPDIRSNPHATVKAERALSPVTGFASTTPLPGSPIPWRTPSSGNHSNRSFSPLPETRDSLLSKQLRELNGSSGLTKGSVSERLGTDSDVDGHKE